MYFEKEFLLCSLLILTQLHINSDATQQKLSTKWQKKQQIGNLSTENSLSNELNIFQWPISLFTAHQYSSKDVEPSVKKSEIKRNLSFSLEDFYFDVFVFFNRNSNDYVKKRDLSNVYFHLHFRTLDDFAIDVFVISLYTYVYTQRLMNRKFQVNLIWLFVWGFELNGNWFPCM